jgi:hypothetical protein
MHKHALRNCSHNRNAPAAKANHCIGCRLTTAALSLQVTLLVTPVDAFEKGIQVPNGCPLIALPTNQVWEFSLR